MIFGIFEIDVIYTLPVLTAFLFALGGSGALSIRRIGVPLAVSLYAWGYGASFISLLIYFIHQFLILGLGYGDEAERKLGKLYWPYIFILGTLYGLCQFGLALHFGGWVSFLVWSLSGGLVFLAGLYSSKKFGLPHKAFEIITGGSLGLTAALIIH